MLPVFTLLLFYSLVVELPTGKTYYKPGVSGRLVKTGTYALTRHPGVLWYILALASLVLVTRSLTLIIAAAVWSVLDIVHVVVQDRVFFPKMFPGYRQYQEETPMLIPSCQSIGACLRTLGARPVKNETL